MVAVASFAPTASTEMLVTATSSNTLIPTTGTPTIAIVSNLDAQPVFIALGTSNAVTATINGSATVMPMSSFAFTIGTNTYIAAITSSGAGAINITVGN